MAGEDLDQDKSYAPRTDPKYDYEHELSCFQRQERIVLQQNAQLDEPEANVVEENREIEALRFTLGLQ